MKLFEIELEGITPLMHHKMNEEDLFSLLGVKGGKKKLKETRTPREIADRHAYRTTDGKYCIPLDYVSGAFRDVASDYKQKNSQRKSYKMIARGVFGPTEEFATLMDTQGNPIDKFEVDIRKATNHQKGAIAVCRPRFEQWKIKFVAELDDTIIEPETALQILEDSGRRAGIGSFRVNRGGYFGKFQVIKWQEIKNSNI